MHGNVQVNNNEKEKVLLSPRDGKTTHLGILWFPGARPRFQTTSSIKTCPSLPTIQRIPEAEPSELLPHAQHCSHTVTAQLPQPERIGRNTKTSADKVSTSAPDPAQRQQDARVAQDLRQNTAPRSERLQSPNSALPRGLHFHFPKLPAYLLFSDGRLGTLHFLKNRQLWAKTHTPCLELCQPTQQRQSWRTTFSVSCSKGSPAGSDCQGLTHTPRLFPGSTKTKLKNFRGKASVAAPQ